MVRSRLVILLLFVASCNRVLDASVPDLHWQLFDSSAALTLPAAARDKMQGVYTIQEQSDDYGSEAALKWSWVIDGKDTSWHLSIFCEEDVRYFIMQGKMLDSTILLNGYWRNVENTKTGKAHLLIRPVDGAARLLYDSTFKPSAGILVTGKVGMFDEEPDKDFQLKYNRPLYEQTYLEIIAHRGGGRNSDLLPASENSIELIKMATRYGATGVELDVKVTKDGMAVLYHDANINDRLTNKTGVHQTVEEYTFAELEKDIRLTDGQKIPTLRQAMETVLNNTPLRLVWLDAKDKEAIPRLREMQMEFTNRAKAANRDLEIYIGIPADDVYEKFRSLPDHRQVPSVCELDSGKTIAINSAIWAQSWVKGLQENEVKAMQSMGKRVFVWTIDAPRVIRYFMKNGRFDGFVTNRPSIIAFYHYSKK